MDLDEQLAALAAGELDDDTARALRARAATDPAIARRLARHRQLQQLLEGWEAPAMSDEAVARLDARIDEALAALDDAPLADERTDSMPLRPLADSAEADAPAAGAPSPGDQRVVDLGEARRRRGLPSWLPGAAVAAALVAVVGTGIVVGGIPGGQDTADMLAEDSAEEPDQPAEAEVAEEQATDGGAQTESSVSAELRSDGGATRVSGIDLAEGDLLALVVSDEAMTGTSSATGDEAGESDESDDSAPSDTDAAEPPAAVTAPADAQCVTEALERDTEQADDRDVVLVGTGHYAGDPAVFVVVRTPAVPEDRFQVLAYDPADCTLLAQDETTR